MLIKEITSRKGSLRIHGVKVVGHTTVVWPTPVAMGLELRAWIPSIEPWRGGVIETSNFAMKHDRTDSICVPSFKTLVEIKSHGWPMRRLLATEQRGVWTITSSNFANCPGMSYQLACIKEGWGGSEEPVGWRT